MTAVEHVKEVLGQINLDSLSDEELHEISEVLIIEETKVKRLIINRKHFSTHFTPEESNC